MSECTAIICSRCAEPLVTKPDDGFCGWCREELTLSAVGALTGPVPERTQAIWFLRDQGYDANAVGRALAAVGDGATAEEAVELLSGEPEAVGAV